MKILNVNINGLKNKKEKIITYINENKFDVINLQEIMIKDDYSVIQEIENKTKGITFMNSTKLFHGVATIIRNDLLKFQIKQMDYGDDIFKNRMIHIQIKTNNVINIINLYAPTGEDKDKTCFYEKFKKYIDKFKNQDLIITGDFNYVTSEKDRQTHKLYSYDKETNKIINFDAYDLIDVFYNFYEDIQAFTTKVSRIDKIFISKHLITKITNFKHGVYISDHKTVEMSIEMENTKRWGNGYWKLNNYFLNDKYYQNEIKELIKQHQEVYYKNPEIKWETLKMKIKKKSISYANYKAQQRKIEEQMCKQIIEGNFDENIKKNTKDLLNSLTQFKNEGIKTRTKNEVLNKIHQKGRHLTRKEEIKNGNSKFINKINGEDDKDKIMENVTNFYQTLYKSQNIEDKDIDTYMDNFNPNKITDEENEILNDYISEQEISFASKNLNENKSPGQDGLTNEFYKTFNDQLTPILCEVYNYILMKGELPESMKTGIITPIYKNKGCTENLKNWRPITLLNTDCKILTKLLTNRLK